MRKERRARRKRGRGEEEEWRGGAESWGKWEGKATEGEKRRGVTDSERERQQRMRGQTEEKERGEEAERRRWEDVESKRRGAEWKRGEEGRRAEVKR